jgi:hypothetical protein
VKLRLIVAALASLSLTAATPVAAHAQVRPQLYACNWTGAMWMGQNSAGVPTVNVSADIELTCGGPWMAPYLVIDRIGPGGNPQFVASGMGYATYTCQGSTPNTYRMDGEVPSGLVYTTGVVNCG